MAAPGRGSAYPVALLLLALFCMDRAHAVVHTVGGASGWDLSVDYKGWAAGETFKVGDILFFPYDPAAHNVVVVDKAGYDACSDTNAIATYSKGNENVTLSSAGAHYYLCSFPGHCPFGMKLAVTVEAAAGPAAPPTTAAPAPAKNTASSPAPATTKKVPSPAPGASPPASPPALAPVSAPTPASTPTPAPATPASAPGVAAPGPSTPLAPASTPSSTTASPPSLESPPNAAPSLIASAAALTLLPLLMASSLLSAL